MTKLSSAYQSATCLWRSKYHILCDMIKDEILSLPLSGAAPYALQASHTSSPRSPVAGDDDNKGTGGGSDDDSNLGIATKTRAKTKKPNLYKVLLLNDDYTPMEFVVLVLKRFFQMDIDEATRVMLHVHQKGVGVCGTFSYEVAETKVTQVMDFARKNQHPLQCTLEKA